MADIIKGVFPRKNAGPEQEDKLIVAYQLHVSLAFSDPPIWRRLAVSGHLTLDALHRVLQCCMGWTNRHTHQFLIGKVFYEPVRDGAEDADRGRFDEAKYQLHQLEEGMRFLFTYIYDFGDAWEHEIRIEQTLPLEEAEPYPRLLAGAGACPPEEVGGIFGYQEFIVAMADPADPRHRSLVDWLGQDHFDPMALDIEGINARLRSLP